MPTTEHTVSPANPWQTSKPSWNPLRCTGLDLPVNLAVLVKVLALVLLVTNHVRLLPDPWLPFIPVLDRFPPLLFQRTLQTVFFPAASLIVFTQITIHHLLL